MKTKQEILLETVEHYKTNPRSSWDGECFYLSTTGGLCAYSRCVKPEHRQDLTENRSASFFANWNSGEFLMDEYRGHSYDFWDGVQELHDKDSHWSAAVKDDYRGCTAGGPLTKKGEAFLQNLLSLYADTLETAPV